MKKINNKDYKKLVETKLPKKNVVKNCALAFVFGGAISVIGQLILDWIISMDIPKDEASIWTSIILIFIGALLTGLGIYTRIGKIAGAGTIVPITGFANSMVSPAIEFKTEGQVFGIGAKIFIVAGPVIVFGLLSSVIICLITYIFKGGIV